MSRIDRRQANEIRETFLQKRYQMHPTGSALIEVGKTVVVCSATVEDRVPHFLKGTGTGWLNAEYSLLPGSSDVRVPRERLKVSGRTAEILSAGLCVR